MNEEIYSIILGNNQEDLFGSENDAVLIYNLFYTFYLKDEYWKKPIIFLNSDVILENLIYSLKKIKKNSTLIIYFSGHSNKLGYLKFYNNLYSSNDILNIINKFSENIYFIIDSCFGKKFLKYNSNIKIRYIVSTTEIQTSKEILINYKKQMFSHKNIIKQTDKIVVGIFTFYFYKILLSENLQNIDEWKNNVLNNEVWFIINKNYNQKIFYYQNF
jgi:hypothetical protein